MGRLAGWAKRIKITVDSSVIDVALSGFPVPIYLSAASGITDADVSCVFDELGSDANRKKIAVTTSDGETQCYVEIERWDHASEKAWLHVKVPAIAADADTDLYLYYDSTQADNTDYVGDTGDAAAQAVWDSDFVGVWHMGQDPTGGAGCILDSTDNGQHMTPAGSMTSGDLVDALFGKGLDFDGVDDYISVAAGKIRLGTDKTIMCLIKPASTDPTVLWSVDALGAYGEGGFSGHLLMWRDSILKNKDYLYADPSVFFDVGVWYCIELTVVDGGRPAKLYNAGELNGESTSGTIYGPEDIRRFAFTPTTGDRKHFKGVACELRCSGVARSAAWLKATYHGLFDSLITFGAEEILGEITEILGEITDAAAVSDTFTAVLLSALITDSISLDDSVQFLQLDDSLPDQTGLGDTISALAEYYPVLTDDAALDDEFIAYDLRGNVDDALELDDALERIAEYMPASTDEAALSDAFSCLNWTEWLRRNITSASKRFYFTLTGSADGVADIEIPISSFQSRLRQSKPTYLSVVIPNIDDYAAEIAARPNGQMVIEMAYLLEGEESVREEICRVDLESVRSDQGGRNQSISLSGHRTETYATKITALSGVSYRNESNGVRRFRCAMDPYLKPGDTVRINDETIEVGYISIARSVKSELMEIVEA